MGPKRREFPGESSKSSRARRWGLLVISHGVQRVVVLTSGLVTNAKPLWFSEHAASARQFCCLEPRRTLALGSTRCVVSVFARPTKG